MGGDTYAALTILRGTLGHSPDPAVVDAVAGLVETLGQVVMAGLVRGWVKGDERAEADEFRGVFDGVETLEVNEHGIG